MEHNVVLTMRGITMTFPGVKALDNVDLTLRKGEIMALENGKIVSTSTDITKATYRLARGMCKKDSSFVTIISGCDRWSIIRPWMHRKRAYPRCIRKSIFARI